MPYLVLGLLALGLALIGANVFVRANPAVLAKVLTRAGGLICLGVALALGLTGRIGLAVPAAALGAGLLTGRSFNPFSSGGRRAPSGGGASTVRSRTVEMTLDHDGGEMTGTVLVGPFAGRSLDDLSIEELERVLMEARDDPDGVRLLEAYLDRRAPGGREDVEGDDGARRGEPGGAGALTLEEACEILGLEPGATAQEITKAHKTLMKRVHPDFGGSPALAARVNAARDRAMESAAA